MAGERTSLRAIGIRVAPRAVHYAVVEVAADVELLTTALVIVPPALELPAQLHFIRTTVLDIMAEYEVRRAGIRLTEPTAIGTSVERLNLEGVIQELLSSSGVEAYFAGPIATIAARLGERDRTRVKDCFEGADFLDFEGWAGFSREQRESVVAAVAAAQLPKPHV